ncbi:hypothetical protein G7Y79_00020g048560 [Physcia stellaris]|nr:hypothetical protein G7Y79_00020g048560 [Physcia stellaris]
MVKGPVLLLTTSLLTTLVTPQLLPFTQSLPLPVHPSISLPLHPSLVAPPVNSATCYVPGGTIQNRPFLSDCYTAIRLVLSERSIVAPQRFSVPRGQPPTPPAPNHIYVPYIRQYKTCLFILDTTDPREEQEFLLIRAAFFAGELVQPCVARQKVPLGGKTTINVGGFFIAVLGADPQDSPGVGNETMDTLLENLRKET